MTKTPEQIAAELKVQEAQAALAADQAGEVAARAAEASGASPEEVAKAVERARQEEKDKLYPTIQALKDSVKDIQDAFRAEREDKERIKQEAEAEKERRRQDKLTTEERQLEALRKIEEQLREEREARETLRTELETRQRESDLRLYRDRAIQATNGELIVELVAGKSEAEIDASINIAKTRYAELITLGKEEAGNKIKKGLAGPTNPDNAAQEEQELSENLSRVDTKKYHADPVYREKIQDEIAKAYGKGIR